MGVLVLRDNLSWKPDDPCQLGAAQAWFDELRDAGFAAERPDGTPVREFDPHEAEIIMSMPVASAEG